MVWMAFRSLDALAGGVLFAVTWASVAESKSASRAVPVPTSGNSAAMLWSDATFVRITLANALSYGAIFAYIAASPVVIIAQMGRSSAEFAGVFACTATALVAGAWISGRLSRRGLSAQALLAPSLIAAAVAAVTLAAVSLAGVTSGAVLMPPLVVVMFARGIIAPNMQHLAIERQRERAGAASAAVGVSQLMAGALASAAVAVVLQSYNLGSVAAIMALLTAGALVIWRRVNP